MPIGAAADAGCAHLRALPGYALGLDVRDYRGRFLIQHTGGLPGYLSQGGDAPRAAAGRGGAHQSGVGRRVQRRSPTGCSTTISARSRSDYLGRLRVAARQQDLAQVSARRERGARPRAIRPRARRSRSARYAGTLPGRLVWRRERRARGRQASPSVSPAARPLVGDLVHWQHDSFLARWRDRELRADAYATFTLDPDGRRAGCGWCPPRPPWTSASISRICSGLVGRSAV